VGFEKGHKKLGGKVKGTPNKITRTVKETVLAVFNDLQSDPKNNLLEFGKKYPRDFYQIAAKLIPTELNAKVEEIKIRFKDAE
jgi:hypothetical protein